MLPSQEVVLLVWRRMGLGPITNHKETLYQSAAAGFPLYEW